MVANVLFPSTKKVSIIKNKFSDFVSRYKHKTGSKRNQWVVPQEVTGPAQVTLDARVTFLIKLHCRF